MTNAIAHTNYDFIGKILADTFREKSFAVYGIDLPAIAQCLPTEFPDVQVTDRVSDRLFLLEDGSYALVDFESQYRLMNKVKYLRYITRVLANYMQEDKGFRLRFIVLYMGNVQSAHPDFSTDCLTIRTEQAFLSHIDGDYELSKILKKLDDGVPLEDEDLMRLIILPLTYNSKYRQVSMIDKTIDSAIRIQDEEKKAFVLAGICIATDKFILNNQARRIGGLLKMTKVGQMLQEEYEHKERDLTQKLEKISKQIEEQDQKLKHQDQQIKHQDQQIKHQDQQIKHQDQQIKHQDQQIKHQDQQIRQYRDCLRKTIMCLLNDGNSVEKIIHITGAEMDEIEDIRAALTTLPVEES